MSDVRLGVAVVTVTYGDRSRFLQSVLVALTGAEEKRLVSRIIVVDNGSHHLTKSYLQELALTESRLRVIRFDVNRGSAAGFKAGIQAACDEGSELIWLLDDDNRPEPHALGEALKHLERLESVQTTRPLATLSLRTDRPHLLRIAEGADPETEFPHASSYLGFRTTVFARGLIRRLQCLMPAVPQRESDTSRVGESSRPAPNTSPVAESWERPIAIPYAPYGGMLFRRSLIAHIGLPDENLFTYADDSEFSSRITRRGGRICLVPSSRIVDIDSSWHIRSPGSMLTKPIREESDFRVYYSIRNRVFFERGLAHGFGYRLNRLVFHTVMHCVAVSTGRWRRLLLLRRAIHDGERGALGVRSDLQP